MQSSGSCGPPCVSWGSCSASCLPKISQPKMAARPCRCRLALRSALPHQCPSRPSLRRAKAVTLLLQLPRSQRGLQLLSPGRTGPLGSAVQPDSKQHTKEEKGSRGKSSTQPRGQGSSTGASGSGGATHLSGPQCSWLDEPGPLRRWTSLTKLNVTFQDDSDSEDEEYYSGLEKQEDDEEEEEEEEDQAAQCPASPWPKLLRDLRFVLPETIFEEDEEGGCEEGASPEPSSPALSVKSSESLRGPGLLAPQSLQSRGDLSRWGGLPNLSPPVKGADFWPLELGGQQGLRAPPPPASEPLDPGPMQAVPALGAG
nr:proline-, glutamic acid- and leucine-rich protein 1-like [Oryctolagus cuniculus]